MKLPPFFTVLLATAMSLGFAAVAFSEEAMITIQNSTGDVIATYTEDQLRRDFALQVLETATPWSKSEEETRFRGPLLSALLARHKLDQQSTINVTASNRFSAAVTEDEIAAYTPVLALEQACTEVDRANGACSPEQQYRPLPEVSGPFQLVWPLDRLPQAYKPGRNAIWVGFVDGIRSVRSIKLAATAD